MSVATIEGIIQNGQVQLPPGTKLPEHARVFVVIPEFAQPADKVAVYSPRLVHPEQAADFTKRVEPEGP